MTRHTQDCHINTLIAMRISAAESECTCEPIQQVWSCGGGTQSAAIAALIVRGKLPKPDISVIADTGREASETWDYYDKVLYPELMKVGVELHRIPHTYYPDVQPGYNTVDIYSGKDKDTIIMPMHTAQGGGILPKYCSNEWKSRPVDRFLREHGIKPPGEMWIGYSFDEQGRCKSADALRAQAADNKLVHRYPLIEMGLRRQESIDIVESMGWGTPPRSACWMCPYHNDQEWKHLKSNYPKDFQKAVELEKELQKTDADVYFHKSLRPLSEAAFDEQGDMFDEPCASGMCFT